MSCPSLEFWLEAIDTRGAAPDGSHVECEACRSNEGAARALLAALRDGVPRSPLSDDEFVRRVVTRGVRVRRSWPAMIALPLAAAAAAAFLLRPQAAPDEPGELVARGSATSPTASCEVALVTPGGLQFLRDGDRVPDGSKLAFRVRNPEQRARWLGVFGVTARGRVGWYHPAYETAQDDPRTLPMPVTQQPMLLDESVALKLGEGPVRVVCWQADHPSKVREADVLVEAASSPGQDLAAWSRIEALGGDQTSILLWLDSSR